ncbi:hypothetical protein N7474_008985 [Penicillium riverlandense]|uniref:uncharacterized protein n=1 Tax=Penicillium riverlandense TaxID=1903569 RepID=UPI0025480922|nr:uncharacterized protein N7474_008985 [Penicillium riverlandense]KAJ5812684.1 hypothetical protein N7474_008985 [Penicillium riverlandense]
MEKQAAQSSSDVSPGATTFSQIGCIGAGFSGIGLGASLYRWYGITDVQFFERRASSGGTWFANNYPGCACDVPSALYSYSFEQNPNWTKLLPDHKELKIYLDEVASKYRLQERMRFQVEVEKFAWDDSSQRWTLWLRDLQTKQPMKHVCQVLFNCGGALVVPNPIAFPKQETFRGDIFHSAEWNHDVDLDGKRVIVIGNGCTGAQIVPALIRAGKVAAVVNIVRSKQWIYPSLDFHYSKFMRWCFKNVPFALQLHRFHIFLYAEQEFSTVQMTPKGARLREKKRKLVEEYMRSASPTKYHSMLIPDFEIGCKRRIYDSGYLQALHDPRVTLTNSPIREFTPAGIRTDDGIIEADVIVVANGFNVHAPLPRGVIIGRDNCDLTDYWKKYGGPGAYNGTAVAPFPNLFFILGPNSGTGHTSAVMPLEKCVSSHLRGNYEDY